MKNENKITYVPAPNLKKFAPSALALFFSRPALWGVAVQFQPASQSPVPLSVLSPKGGHRGQGCPYFQDGQECTPHLSHFVLFPYLLPFQTYEAGDSLAPEGGWCNRCSIPVPTCLPEGKINVHLPIWGCDTIGASILMDNLVEVVPQNEYILARVRNHGRDRIEVKLNKGYGKGESKLVGELTSQLDLERRRSLAVSEGRNIPPPSNGIRSLLSERRLTSIAKAIPDPPSCRCPR